MEVTSWLSFWQTHDPTKGEWQTEHKKDGGSLAAQTDRSARRTGPSQRWMEGNGAIFLLTHSR